MPGLGGFLGGIGSGMKKTFQNDDFVNALASMQGGGGDDIFSKIMGGLGKGAAMAQQMKASKTQAGGGAPPKPMDNSDVPLAGPMGGPPPGVGEAGIPGAPDMGAPPPPPPPEMMGGMGGPPSPEAGGASSPFSKFAGGEDDYIKKALRGMGQMGSMGF